MQKEEDEMFEGHTDLSKLCKTWFVGSVWLSGNKLMRLLDTRCLYIGKKQKPGLKSGAVERLSQRLSKLPIVC